jgi:hypothetical protein
VPRALQRPIRQDVALRHRKVLVGTDIAQSGDFTVMPNQADRVARGSHALQNRPFGKLRY